MGLFAKLFAEIWRDYATDGVPASGANRAVKSDIRAWGETVEGALATAPLLLTSVAGTGNVVTATTSPAIASYAGGQVFAYIPTAPNTGAVTINLNTLGARPVVRPSGAALGGGEFAVGTMALLIYDGTSLRMAAAPTLDASATYNPPSLIDGAGITTTVTVTGAAIIDYAEASFSLDLQGITVTAWVSAANTVSVRFQNETGNTIDLASGTLRARVRRA